MIEITNRKRHPVQLLVKSKEMPRTFTTLSIPAVGKGKNVYLLPEELKTEYIDRAEHDWKFITTRIVPDKICKGE